MPKFEYTAKSDTYSLPQEANDSSGLVAKPRPDRTLQRRLDMLVQQRRAEIKTYVKQPRFSRKPIGYQFSFLEKYQPNHSYYLTVALRNHLHGVGQCSPTPGGAPGAFAREHFTDLLIDFAWASSALEGNSYTREETAAVIDSGRTRDGKSAAESQMILNHRDALDYLIKEPDHASLNSDTIIALHAFLSSGLMADPRGCGRLRSAAISISNTVYSPPSDPKRIESLFANVIGRAAQIRDPFEQAFFLLVHLSYLQPFESVNKRIARLAANVPLIQANLCPLTFVSVSDEAYAEGLLGVFELNRVELLLDFFIDAYEKSCNAYLAVSTTDDFSLKYRDLVRAVVTIMLRHGQQASEEAVRHCIPSAVQKEDQDKFVGLILSEFQSMHAGNAIRFGLKPSEFLAWQQTALKNAKSN